MLREGRGADKIRERGSDEGFGEEEGGEEDTDGLGNEGEGGGFSVVFLFGEGKDRYAEQDIIVPSDR